MTRELTEFVLFVCLLFLLSSAWSLCHAADDRSPFEHCRLLLERGREGDVDSAFRAALKSINGDRRMVAKYMTLFRGHPDKLNSLDAIDSELALRQAGPAMMTPHEGGASTSRKGAHERVLKGRREGRDVPVGAITKPDDAYRKGTMYSEKDLTAAEKAEIDRLVNEHYADPRVTSPTKVHFGDGTVVDSLAQTHAREALRSQIALEMLMKKAGDTGSSQGSNQSKSSRSSRDRSKTRGESIFPKRLKWRLDQQ